MQGMMKPPGGLLQMAQPQRRPAPAPGSPQGMAAMGQPQFDASQFFEQAAARLVKPDPDLRGDIKAQARAIEMQGMQLMKLMQMGQQMGQDVSALAPILEQLKKQRQAIFKKMIGGQTKA